VVVVCTDHDPLAGQIAAPRDHSDHVAGRGSLELDSARPEGPQVAVAGTRLETVILEPVGDVTRSLQLVLGAAASAVQAVVGQELEVLEEPLLGERRQDPGVAAVAAGGDRECNGNKQESFHRICSILRQSLSLAIQSSCPQVRLGSSRILKTYVLALSPRN
jgi:hypothetical protein